MNAAPRNGGFFYRNKKTNIFLQKSIDKELMFGYNHIKLSKHTFALKEDYYETKN